MSISVRHLSKRFGSFVALDDVCLEIPSDSLVALLGPSGSGKTTLLRIMAGLESADCGEIRFHGENMAARHARDRGIGFVFQHYALFRHMTVFENVAFGMRVRHVPNVEVKSRVRELLSLVRLSGLESRYPAELSGGQRQRVALARALAVRPKMLLLDEPFGALDAKVRQELRAWLRRLHEEMRVTTVFVTHDQEEAFELADIVAVMRNGRVEQVGAPDEVFEKPATPFVMDFLGHVNVFHGRVQAGAAHVGPFQVAFDEYPHEEPRDATGYVRPHELEIDRVATGPSCLRGRIAQITPSGPLVKVRVVAESLGLEVQVDLLRERARTLALTVNELVFVRPKSIRVFVPEHDYAI